MAPPLKHNSQGIASTVIGSVSLILFFTVFALATYFYSDGRLAKGTCQIIITLLVIFNFLLVICGFTYGLRGLFEPLSKKIFSIIGTVLNSILLASFITVIALGTFRYLSR